MNLIVIFAVVGQFSTLPSPSPTLFASLPAVQMPLPVPEVVEPNPIPVPGVQLIAFTSTWCGPCAKMKPILTAMEADGVTIQRVDFDRDKTLVAKYKVVTLPTVVVLRGGKEVVRKVGLVTLETLRNIIQPFRAVHRHAELGGAVCTVCGGTCAMLRAAEAAARAKGDVSKEAVETEFTRMYGSGTCSRPRIFGRWRR
jgi:thioredoxin 1